MSPLPRHELGYLPALDGLRAIAVLIVMGSHAISPRIPGSFGVTLFFFISGFIITRQCIERPFGFEDVLPFYLKRFFRLAPAVFAYIFAATALIGLLGGRIPWADIRATLLYYANYHSYSHTVTANTSLPPLEMTWSLAVEEHFYVCFPLALLWARSLTRLAGLLIGVIAAACIWRLWRVMHGALEWPVMTHTDTRLDSIAYGCLLSVALALAVDRPRLAPWPGTLGKTVVAGAALVVIAASFSFTSFRMRGVIVLPLQGWALMPIFCFLLFNRTPAAQFGLTPIPRTV